MGVGRRILLTYEEYFDSAENQYIQKNYENALKLFELARLEDDTRDCENYIGCCYLQLDDYESALKIFVGLSDKYPQWERPVFNYGRTLMKMGRMEDAIVALKDVERINPNDIDALYYLGYYYESRKEYLRACEYYRRSIEIDHSQAETHLNLGICYAKLGERDKAIHEFEEAFKIDEELYDALFNIALMYIGKKQYHKASELLMKAHSANKEDLEIMNDLAYVNFKMGDIENARYWIDKVIKIDPNSTSAMDLLKKMMN